MNLIRTRLYLITDDEEKGKMKQMKDAEDIIISKRFFELTPGELEAVKEFASNEEDYDAMRWFLKSTKSTFEEEKIDASPALRTSVMAHLSQKKPSQTIWLNGVGAFMFPSQKKFYQYPAFQIAAVAIILVGFVFMYDGTLNSDKELAVNENDDLIGNGNKEIISNEESTGEINGQSPGVETKSEPGKDQDLRTEQVIEPAESESAGVSTNASDGSYNLASMSVAEESRIGTTEKLLLEEQKQYGITNTPDQTYYRSDVVEEKNIKLDNLSEAPADDIAIKGELKKEGKEDVKDYKTPDNSKTAELNDVETVPATIATNGTTTTTATGSGTTIVVSTDKEKSIDEGGKYNTATAGGVFGDTASEPEADLDSTLEVEIPAKEFSLSESKELRALFFVVK